MSESNDAAGKRLEEIAHLVGRALVLADNDEDFLLGAKLSESLLHVRERLDALGRRDRS